MKLSEVLNGGQVTLQIPYTNTMHEFTSRVLGQMNGVMILSSASYGGRALRMPDKDGINIVYQVLNRLYIWRHVNLETLEYMGKVFYRIKSTDIESGIYNRRGSYRLTLNMDMNLGVYISVIPEEKNVTVRDISESGICFITKEDIDMHKKVHMYYETEEGTYDMMGFIVRKVLDTESGKFTYGCQMDEFNTALGSFIMKEQMRRRRTA